MKQQNCQFDEDYVCVEYEDDNQKASAQDNSNPQQGVSVFPRSISMPTKAKKNCNTLKTPITGKPSMRQKVSQIKEDLEISSICDSVQYLERSDTKKQIINKNAVTQLKIPPYKRDSRKLFVGGLPAGLNGDEFRSIFEKFGTILDSVVIIDRNTKRSRGFGFVTFEDPVVAQKVLHSGNNPMNTPTNATGLSGSIIIRGKRCEIKASQPKEMSSSPPSNGNKRHKLQNQCVPSEDILMINPEDMSLDRSVPVNDYSGVLPPPLNQYNMYRQIHSPNGIGSGGNYHNANPHMGEQLPPYAEPFSDGRAYSNVNPYDGPVTNGGQHPPYVERFGIGGGDEMTYQNQLQYPPQPFIYGNGNGGGLYVPQMMLPHAYHFAAMQPQPSTNCPPVAMGIPCNPTMYPGQKEQFKSSSSIGDKP